MMYKAKQEYRGTCSENILFAAGLIIFFYALTGGVGSPNRTGVSSSPDHPTFPTYSSDIPSSPPPLDWHDSPAPGDCGGRFPDGTIKWLSDEQSSGYLICRDTKWWNGLEGVPEKTPIDNPQGQVKH